MSATTPLRVAGFCFALMMLAGALPAQQAPSDYPAAAVMYANFAPNNPRLFIADGDGGNAKPLLAQSGYDYNASLSADGRWVVFTSERDDSADIWRVHPDGTGLERLTDDRAYDDRGVLSPDGRWLAFVSTRGTGNANLWLLDLRTRTLKNLTAGSTGDYRPAWSPDSTQIAFSSIRDATPLQAGADPAVEAKRLTSDIYVVQREGTKPRRLTNSGVILQSPSWSPDGKKIACIELRARPATGAGPIAQISKIVSIDIADGHVVALTEETSAFDSSPASPQWVSASRVAYVTQRGIGFSDGAKGSQGQYGSPHWSADGRVMVFGREANPELSLSGFGSPAFGSPTAFKVGTALDPHFRIVRTGIFPSSRQLPGSHEIVMNNLSAGLPLGRRGNAVIAVAPDGMKQRVILEDAQRNAVAPAVSPDGQQIAVGLAIGPLTMAAGRRANASSRLALVRADGSGVRELPAAGEHAGYPSWSADGTRLVYVNGGPPAERGLRILDIASGQVMTLTTGPDQFPSWSPLGDRIAFTRSASGASGASQIYTIGADGSGLTRLTFSAGAQDAHPVWSPDGRWIAFTSARISPRDEDTISSPDHAVGQIFVMRADGTDVRQLTDTQYQSGTPGWLPVDDKEVQNASGVIR